MLTVHRICLAALCLTAAAGGCTTRTLLGDNIDGAAPGGNGGKSGGSGGKPGSSGGAGGSPGGDGGITGSGGGLPGGDGGSNTGGVVGEGGSGGTSLPATGGAGSEDCEDGAAGGAGNLPANRPIFRAAARYAVGRGVVALAVGDLTGDGRPDVGALTFASATPGSGGVTGNPGSGGSNTGGANGAPTPGYVAILLNGGSGTLGVATYYPAGPDPTFATFGDLDGDGKSDLAVANGSSSGSVSVLTNKGNGTFGSLVSYATGVRATSVAIADLDADQRRDIVVTNGGLNEQPGDIAVLINGGSGVFLARNIPAGTDPSAVAVGDLNGDQRPDLAVANGSSSLAVLNNDGLGGFETPKLLAVGTRPSGVALGDLNGDGRLDIALSSFFTRNTSVLLGVTGGAFTAAVNYPTGQAASLAFGDLNGDAKADLVFPYFSSSCGRVGTILNNGNGTFGPLVTFPVADPWVAQVIPADLDGDGKIDLVVATAIGITVLMNETPP